MTKDIRTDRGTAAQSGAGDLALIGVLPVAFAMPAPAHAVEAKVGPATSPRSSEDGSAIASPETANAVLPIEAAATVVGALQPAIIAAAAVPGTIEARVPADAPYGAEGGRDMLHGHVAFDGGQEGQALPLPPASVPDLPVAPATSGAAASVAPVTSVPLAADLATIETIRASVATLQEALDALGARVDGTVRGGVEDVVADIAPTIAALDASLAGVGEGAGAIVGNIASQADDLITGTVADVGTLAGSLATQVTATVSTVAADVSQLGTAATATLGDVAGIATGTLGAAMAQVGALPLDPTPVTDLLGDALDDAVTTVGTVSVPALDVAGGVIGGGAATVQAAPGAIDDGLSALLDDDPGGLAGADPAAGITTLVGMVSASDAFQLNDDGDAPVLEPALGILGAADVLAEAHPAESLLGIADNDHGGLLGGLHDDDHGLLGLA